MSDGHEDKEKPDGVVLDSLTRQQRDVIDLNNEIAERQTGRIHRFNIDASHDEITLREQKKTRELTALLRLLQNPDYARLYYRTEKAIDRASRAAEAALAANTRDSAELRQHLEKMRDAAPRLADGRRFFMSDSGKFYTEHGEDVTDDARIINLPKNAPTWEGYTREREKLDALNRQRMEIDEYRDGVLNPANKRLADEDHPPGERELERILQDVTEKMPEDIRSHADVSAAKPDTASADDFLDDEALNAPDLPAHFRAAHDGPADAPPGTTPAVVIAPKAVT